MFPEVVPLRTEHTIVLWSGVEAGKASVPVATLRHVSVLPVMTGLPVACTRGVRGWLCPPDTATMGGICFQVARPQGWRRHCIGGGNATDHRWYWVWLAAAGESP